MFEYWGKADPTFAAPADYHPLPLHALDVAAVGAAYLDAHPRLLDFFAGTLGLSREHARSWLVFWLALHDLGKFATSFQRQRDDLLLRLQGRSCAESFPYSVRHDSLGAALWQYRLLVQHDVLDLGPRATAMLGRLQPWVAAVTGHHGQPPQVGIQPIAHFVEADELAAAHFVREARSLLLPADTLAAALALPAERLRDAGKGLSWWLAGLAVLADWLGSNTTFFPYRPESIALGDYWKSARDQAERAIRDTGVLPQPSAVAQSLSRLFAWTDGQTPTPLQAWAGAIDIPCTPQLYLLEDVTGAGKTEAALLLAHRLMAAGQADGVFIGLPTMATANAMHRRVAAMAPRLYASGATPSLALAHAQRALVPGFRDSVLPPSAPERDAAQQDETASARCAAWLADSNKKSLLANIGVGTIDQALLAILHARHQSLRVLGLFGKVLIVDEVHAYDAYMQPLLERLLHFHAASGGSAILLSATLPQRMKQSLAAAYAKGRGVAAPALASMDYPLAARLCGEILREDATDTRPEVRRRVDADYCVEEDEVCRRIADAVSQGRCVGWVRNTIADALSAWERLKQVLSADRLTLFHARFALGDRLATEQAVLNAFGPDSTPDTRAGRVVVATQVIEQSLDVDFDLLISDLAPIDRLIQRAGRLQRHVRDEHGHRIAGLRDGRGGARLIVYGPPCDDEPQADWYRRVFPGGAHVYPHVGQLWLTARLLGEGGFAMPEDGRRWIEAVFGEDAQTDIPEALRAASDAVEGKDHAAMNLAHANRLELATGYSRGHHGDWFADAEAPGVAALDDWAGEAAATRLGELTTTVRLARKADAVWTPWHPDGWEASSLRLPARLIVEPVLSALEQPAYERTKETLPDRGRWSVLLPLEQGESGWVGLATDIRGDVRRWCYDAKKGLTDGR